MLKRIMRIAGKAFFWIAGIAAALTVLTVTVLTIAEFQPKASEILEAEKSGQLKVLREGDRIDLLTYDIGYAGLDGGRDYFADGGTQNTPASKMVVAENLAGLIEQIKSGEYDVLFLQEVDRDSKRSYSIDQESSLFDQIGGSSVFAQDYRCLFVPYPLGDAIGRVNSGMQTLTKYEIREAERIDLPTCNKWPMRIWRPKRCMLVTRVPVEGSGRELVLINLNMEAWKSEGYNEQTIMLFDFMQKEYDLGNYVIAGGNFNQAFPEDDFFAYPIRQNHHFEPEHLRREMLEGEWSFVSDTSAPTMRLMEAPYDQMRWWSQYYVLDGYVASPNVEIESVETLDYEFEYSYHNPVRMTVTLEK